VDVESDPFLEGHEDRTPPELFAVRPADTPPDGPGWSVRVVPNLYPALDPASPEPPPQAKPDLYTAMAARGGHEVIVNTPRPHTTLLELGAGQLETAMQVWKDRMRHHVAAGAACVHVLVNERREGGASLPHSHAQLYALDFVPAMVARERERFHAYATRTMGGNLLADLVQEEVRIRERLVAVDDEVVCFAPYASSVPYQLLIAPRRAAARYEDDDTTGARMLHDVLGRLARRLGASPPLNLWIRTAPLGAEQFCWRIDVLPRLTHLAGLEVGTGVNLNIVAPEQAADDLRNA